MLALTSSILVLSLQVLGSCGNSLESCPTCASDADGSAMLQLKGEKPCKKKAPRRSALIVVDMQNDFISGNLSVNGGESVISTINSLAELPGWGLVAYTMDYHPDNHISFADNSPFNKNPFDFVDVKYDENGRICGQEYEPLYGRTVNPNCSEADVVSNFSQQLWPVHCVQGTWGQHLDERVAFPKSYAVVRKGANVDADSYGAFENNIVFLMDSPSDDNLDKLEMVSESSLEALLKAADVENVYVTGLALDYCVKYTSLQAMDRSFKTFLIQDATMPVFDEQGKEATQELKDNGVHIVSASEVPAKR